jgi:hypothetical protein
MLGASAPSDVNTEAPGPRLKRTRREAGARRLQELAEIGTSWAEIVARDVYLAMAVAMGEAPVKSALQNPAYQVVARGLYARVLKEGDQHPPTAPRAWRHLQETHRIREAMREGTLAPMGGAGGSGFL